MSRCPGGAPDLGKPLGMSRDIAPMERIDATAAVPITVASNALMGARELQQRMRRELGRQAAAAKVEWQRFRLWMERQHLDPNLVAHLLAIALASVATIVEAWANVHRHRSE